MCAEDQSHSLSSNLFYECGINRVFPSFLISERSFSRGLEHAKERDVCDYRTIIVSHVIRRTVLLLYRLCFRKQINRLTYVQSLSKAARSSHDLLILFFPRDTQCGGHPSLGRREGEKLEIEQLRDKLLLMCACLHLRAPFLAAHQPRKSGKS